MLKAKWDLLIFSWILGVISAVRGHLNIGVKQMIAPILYWRFPEFSESLSAIDAAGTGSLKILDIGSPKLLSLFLAIKRNHTVFATDLQDHDIFKRYKQHFEDWTLLKGSSGEYNVEFQDARSLQYADNTFDIVFSLEVLGHIPDSGDMQAMQEIHRVLKKGGVAIIAVPYSNEAGDLFVQNDVYDRPFDGKPIFFVRQYDEQSVRDRLVKASDMVLDKKTVMGERLPFDSWWDRVPALLKIPFMPFEAFMSRINLKVINEDSLLKEKAGRNKRRMNITLIFKKQ